MEHTITAEEFFNSGLPVSDDIRSEEVDFSINTVEQFFVKQYLGETFNAIIADPSTYSDILNAPDGLKQAMYQLVFGYMLYTNIRLTRYASVIKDDEHSTGPSMKDLLEMSRLYWETGTVFLYRVCKSFDIDPTKVKRNDFIFNELLY